MSEHYHGMALQRFEPHMLTHSDTTRIARLTEFRAATNALINVQISQAPRFTGPFVEVAMRDAGFQPNASQPPAD